MLRNQFQTVLQDRHHAETEEVHLDDAEVGAVFFVPLHDSTPWHGSPLQRNYLVQLALADHHAARVLPEMTR